MPRMADAQRHFIRARNRRIDRNQKRDQIIIRKAIHKGPIRLLVLIVHPPVLVIIIIVDANVRIWSRGAETHL